MAFDHAVMALKRCFNIPIEEQRWEDDDDQEQEAYKILNISEAH